MADPSDVDARAARAGLRAKRVALVVALVISVWFIAVSCLDIVPAVFGAGVVPLPPSPPGSSPRACAEGVRRLVAAPEGPAAAGDAEATVARACLESSEGVGAWASLARLRRARAQLAGKPGDDLGPLEQDVAAHLPAEPR
jgi:hypothetical protein